jgi:glycosyltransferase involved in cell wall biosynthesis
MKRQILACLTNGLRYRVETVWNEVDTDWFAPTPDLIPLRLRLGLDPLEKHVSVIAALTPHKGHIHFLQVAKRILSRVSRTTFHIIGSSVSFSERHGQFLAELARDMQISARVRFWGFVPDSLARDILCASDLFILPTEEEGFGLSVAEAQSCQVPVLTSSIPPLDEVVDNGRTGYLIQPKDYDQFANQAVRLLQCDEVRKEMGIAGRRWVCERFGHPTHAMRVMSLYQQISSGKVPGSEVISQYDS